MPVYHLVAAVTVSAYTQVAADTLEEAIKIASNRSVEIDKDFGRGAFDSWIIEDGDGKPTGISEA